jgi:hypothetical protein
MARHPAPTRPVRPRYSRLAAAGSSFGITLVAVLGGVGAIDGGDPDDEVATVSSVRSVAAPAVREPRQERHRTSASRSMESQRFGRQDNDRQRRASTSLEVPADSGTGRRIVFDMSDQRVWLVSARGEARRTYLVSGSVTDNLAPGSYEVYSKSERAWGIDDSGTMRYMVRFAHGNRAAIGFHDIPVKDDELVQTRAQLGSPQSHGCIRQWRPDAEALWDFAPVGTQVVVLA